MKKKKEFCCPHCGSNNERRFKMESDIFFGSTFSTKDMLVLFKFKRKAKTKECRDCGAIEVTCPFCEQSTIQMEETQSYHCPFCLKRSFICTSWSIGTVSKKEFNDI
jgi:uncharacterized Zn-finger protein